mmetsp:Transcript_9937/g.22565  ORF Transcript_9937/g.22565 Transcript_9937/m.22565 type:complete len:172 (-) Transcript_9937:60-575(-)
MADLEHAGLLHCWARSLPRQAARACSLCSLHLLSPQGSATSSCDDTPKWRETLAAPEEEETVPDDAATDIINKKIFLSPAKTIFKRKVRWKAVSRRLEKARMSTGKHSPLSPFVMAGMLAWLMAGGRMILSSQTRPLGQKVPQIRDSPALQFASPRRSHAGSACGRVVYCL